MSARQIRPPIECATRNTWSASRVFASTRSTSLPRPRGVLDPKRERLRAQRVGCRVIEPVHQNRVRVDGVRVSVLQQLLLAAADPQLIAVLDEQPQQRTLKLIELRPALPTDPDVRCA